MKFTKNISIAIKKGKIIPKSRSGLDKYAI